MVWSGNIPCRIDRRWISLPLSPFLKFAFWIFVLMIEQDIFRSPLQERIDKLPDSFNMLIQIKSSDDCFEGITEQSRSRSPPSLDFAVYPAASPFQGQSHAQSLPVGQCAPGLSASASNHLPAFQGNGDKAMPPPQNRAPHPRGTQAVRCPPGLQDVHSEMNGVSAPCLTAKYLSFPEGPLQPVPPETLFHCFVGDSPKKLLL